MLNNAMTRQLNDLDKLTLIGPADPKLRSGIFTFSIEGLNPHDTAMILDEVANIMVRSGMYCVHSWCNINASQGSVRASLYIYNTLDEVKVFADTVKQVTKDLAE
jgi:cysteine desulfurase/selenocysteine lyase